MTTSQIPAPSVFVSSTVRDLIDVRSGVKYVLESQGFSVLLSERSDFDVRGDRSAIDECLENIRASDYYVLIIDARCGGLYLNENISITRKEFRTAIEQYLATGKPKIFPYVRKLIDDVMGRSSQEQIESGIDYPDHLSSFLHEVKNPQNSGVKSFVTLFSDLSELIASLSSRINFGRNFAETLVRRSLVSELAGNLAKMSTRSGNTAFPNHVMMSQVAKDIKFDDGIPVGQTEVTATHRHQLMFAWPGLIRVSGLKTSAIEGAINDGVFLDYNATTSWPDKSAIHAELETTLDLIHSLELIVDPSVTTEWSEHLIADVIKNKDWNRGCVVQTYDLAMACTYHNRIANIFNSHLALCQFLKGITESLPKYERLPQTYRGEVQDRSMKEERVTAAEIERLVGNRSFPFGGRQIIGNSEDSRESKILKVRKMFRDQYPGLDEGAINAIGLIEVDEIIAPSEDGIEDLRGDGSS